jgi:hypothetical protein
MGEVRWDESLNGLARRRRSRVGWWEGGPLGLSTVFGRVRKDRKTGGQQRHDFHCPPLSVHSTVDSQSLEDPPKSKFKRMEQVTGLREANEGGFADGALYCASGSWFSDVDTVVIAFGR